MRIRSVTSIFLSAVLFNLLISYSALAACSALTPSASPSTNRANIQNCLDTEGQAILQSGLYEVDDTITVPDNATLKGNTSLPQIRLVGSTKQRLIRVMSNTRVGFLRLNGNNLVSGTNSGVVHVSGSGAYIDNNRIYNTSMPSGTTPIGVYFIGGTSSGNTLYNSQVYNNFLGVVFQSAYTSSNTNKIQKSRVYDNKCDGVTFSGYGIADDSDIYQNGFDCENGIPGAGIYSINNTNGAKVSNSEIWNNCGYNIDLDKVSSFLIEGNESYTPGYQWGGIYPDCKGMTSVAIVDSKNNTIRYNSITNDGRPSNRIEYNFTIRSMSYPDGGVEYQDFPHGNKQVVAFFIGRRKGSTYKVTNNQVSNNIFKSYCTPTTECVGMGFYMSRNTGYDNSQNWQPSLFTSNNVFGSQYGSLRCGGNWYAGNSTCPQNPTDPLCNSDDYQHNPPVGDSYRNDLCWVY